MTDDRKYALSILTAVAYPEILAEKLGYIPKFTLKNRILKKAIREVKKTGDTSMVVTTKLAGNGDVIYLAVYDHPAWTKRNAFTPGVVLCEVAAQMASYFTTKHNMFNGAVMGFAGLEEVKFRGMVRPGDRVVIQSEMIKWRKILITARFMCIVRDAIVCEGVLKGVPLPIE